MLSYVFSYERIALFMSCCYQIWLTFFSQVQWCNKLIKKLPFITFIMFFECQSVLWHALFLTVICMYFKVFKMFLNFVLPLCWMIGNAIDKHSWDVSTSDIIVLSCHIRY